MSNNHFSYFRVKNFKRFKDLEVKDIGQFNLVLGDNNVGKTSLLEALMWKPANNLDQTETSDNTIEAMIKAVSFRNPKDIISVFWSYFLNSADEKIMFSSSQDQGFEEAIIPVNSSGLIIKKEYYNTVYTNSDIFIISDQSVKSGKIPLFDLKKEQRIISIPDTLDFCIVPLVAFCRNTNSEIADIYIETIQADKKQKSQFLNSLNVLFKEVEDIEPTIRKGQTSLIVRTVSSNASRLLNFYGEGTIKAANILSYIFHFKGERLMIDEVDAGIHYSRMKDYWKAILQSASESNVQIFATTHNRECMESYKVALEELGQDYMVKARSITLRESSKSNEITAYTHSFEVLQDAIETGNDLR